MHDANLSLFPLNQSSALPNFDLKFSHTICHAQLLSSIPAYLSEHGCIDIFKSSKS